MTAAMLVTPAGLAGFQSIQPEGVGQVLAELAFDRRGRHGGFVALPAHGRALGR